MSGYNSYSRDPWVRTFFNKETGIFTFYRLDFYIDVGPAVSLLRYAKGDGGLPDYAPDFFLQLLGANLMGSTHATSSARPGFHRLPPPAPQPPH